MPTPAAAFFLLYVSVFTSHAATVLGVGLGLTAHLLGVRHAFDADHIAVVDNTNASWSAKADRRPAQASGSPWGTPAWCSV
jgi:high-affinity nickel permease